MSRDTAFSDGQRELMTLDLVAAFGSLTERDEFPIHRPQAKIRHEIENN